MTKQRNSNTGTIWHVHHGYARSSCRHRTEYALRRCAERVERRRARDEREGATTPKQDWIAGLAARKAERGYSPEEVAAYVADLEERYADAPDAEFEARRSEALDASVEEAGA